MSSNNLFETSELTIDLDFDDDDYSHLDKNTLNDRNQDNGIVIDDPIQLDQVKIKFDNSVLIKQLSDIIKDTISLNLEVPPYVSIGSWIDISNFFNVDSTEQLKIENNVNPGQELIKVLGNYPAIRLFEALELSKRIDILLLVKRLMKSNGYLNSNTGFHSVSTNKIATSSNLRSELTHSSNIILVNHFEKNDVEKKNYKWFLKNLRKHLESQNFLNLLVMDVSDLEQDGGNIIKTIHDVYTQARHIIVCYNGSYLEGLKTDVEMSFNYRKYIHQQTISEFFTNGMKNKRCRCVLMPGTTSAEGVGWSSVTYQYTFPEGFQLLLERLKRKDDDNLNTL